MPPVDTALITREHIDQMVRETVDKYALTGPYMAAMGALGAYGDEEIMRINGMLSEELYFYTRGYYERHPMDRFPEGTV